MATDLDYDCLDQSLIKKLHDAGFESHTEIAMAAPAVLMETLDVDKETAAKLTQEARRFVPLDTKFEPATSFEPSVDMTKLDVPNEVQYWQLFIHEHNRIGWKSPAGYRLFINGHQCRVWRELRYEDSELPDMITNDQVFGMRRLTRKMHRNGQLTE